MRILVIDQCSGSKEVPEWFTPYDEEDLDSYTRKELLSDVRDRVPSLRAEKLYQGRQQQYITEASKQLRSTGDEVDRVFISAGFGVVDETTELPPYEVTFNDCSSTEVRERGKALNIGRDLQAHLTDGNPYDLVFVALGQSYLHSFDIDEFLSRLPKTTSVVLFNLESVANEYDRVRSIPARTAEAKELGTIVVAIKGRYLQNFAAHRAQGSAVDSISDVVAYCQSAPTSQSTLEGN